VHQQITPNRWQGSELAEADAKKVEDESGYAMAWLCPSQTFSVCERIMQSMSRAAGPIALGIALVGIIQSFV